LPPRLVPGTVLDQKLQGYSQFCLKGREVIGLLELQQEHDGDEVGGVQILEKATQAPRRLLAMAEEVR
jgi:hypothetical protein